MKWCLAEGGGEGGGRGRRREERKDGKGREGGGEREEGLLEGLAAYIRNIKRQRHVFSPKKASRQATCEQSHPKFQTRSSHILTSF